jgi:hypothetical protein
MDSDRVDHRGHRRLRGRKRRGIRRGPAILVFSVISALSVVL